MDALTFYAVAFVAIWVLALLFKDKLKIDITGPILMRKTTRLRDFIDSIAQISPRFWRGFMVVGIFITGFFMVTNLPLLFYALEQVIQSMITPHGAAATSAAVGIALPGVVIPGSGFTVPLGYGLVALVTVLVFHEFAHGILARAEGIKIKSIGLMIMAVLPGAFVEPDEEGVEKASKLSRLRIFAAGSMANIVVAVIAFLLFTLIGFSFIGTSFHSQGVEVINTMPDTPAYGVLQNGMIITNINGQEVTNITNFGDTLGKTHPGNVVNVTTDQGTFKLKTVANPGNSSHAYLGVITQNHLTVNQDVSSKYGDILPWILYNLYWLLYWIFFLNIGIGTFNLLPAKPLDGGLMLEELLNYVTSSDIANKITNTVSVISWLTVAGLFGVIVIPLVS